MSTDWEAEARRLRKEVERLKHTGQRVRLAAGAIEGHAMAERIYGPELRRDCPRCAALVALCWALVRRHPDTRGTVSAISGGLVAMTAKRSPLDAREKLWNAIKIYAVDCWSDDTRRQARERVNRAIREVRKEAVNERFTH
jgi:hypothetical protein